MYLLSKAPLILDTRPQLQLARNKHHDYPAIYLKSSSIAISFIKHVLGLSRLWSPGVNPRFDMSWSQTRV
jgi:hypothetical protein